MQFGRAGGEASQEQHSLDPDDERGDRAEHDDPHREPALLQELLGLGEVHGDCITRSSSGLLTAGACRRYKPLSCPPRPTPPPPARGQRGAPPPPPPTSLPAPGASARAPLPSRARPPLPPPGPVR